MSSQKEIKKQEERLKHGDNAEILLPLTTIQGNEEMKKAYKFTTIFVLVYSVALFLLGLFSCGWLLFLSRESLWQFAIAAFADIDTFLINFLFLDYLTLSSGAVGFFLGLSILKKNPESCRLWLLFITWQTALSIIQIGPYPLGSPTLYETAIVGGLLLCSWATYTDMTIGRFTLFGKNRLLEFCVLFVVVTQLSAIVYLNAREDSHQYGPNLSEEELDKRIKSSVMRGMKEKMMQETLGKHHKEYVRLFELSDPTEIKELGEYLLENGYAESRLVLMTLGIERFSAGKISEAVDYLQRALKGRYSEFERPAEEFIDFEDAELHYMLFLLYTEQMDSVKAQEEYQKAEALFKKFQQKTSHQFSMEKFKSLCEQTLNSLNTAPLPTTNSTAPEIRADDDRR